MSEDICKYQDNTIQDKPPLLTRLLPWFKTILLSASLLSSYSWSREGHVEAVLDSYGREREAEAGTAPSTPDRITRKPRFIRNTSNPQCCA